MTENQALPMSDHVPEEIVTHILSGFPVKSLLRFRCVAKQWLDIIDSPIFMKSHLNQSLKTNSNRTLILEGREFYSLDFDSLDYPTKLNCPLKYAKSVLGSCNGILCLRDLYDKILLWNPSTRNCHNIPPSIQTSNRFIDSDSMYSFGYDHLNDDYKVVKILHVFTTGFLTSQIEIYSLKSNLWLRITDFPYYFLQSNYSDTFVSGALHWVVKPKPESYRVHVIVAFDLETEEFHFVPQIDYLDKHLELNVGVLGGCLRVLLYFPYKVDIWVMKSYGVKESWTLLASIVQPAGSLYFKAPRPVAYSKTGKKILLRQDNGAFVWYDLRNKTLEKVEVHGLPKYFTARVCLGSFVQISGGGNNGRKKRPLEKGEKRKSFA